MTEVSKRYRRLSDAFAAKIAAVPPSAWDAPTPCTDWTARDLVGHVVSTQGLILGLVGRTAGHIPSVDDDPLAAFDAARTAVQRDLEDPDVATSEYDGQMGRMTLEDAVDRFLCTDLVVHGWDLAHAVGLEERIAPEDLRGVRSTAESFGDAMRSPGAFGPAVDPPPGSDEQTRLLAFLGRRI
jgi:uncharacterized protein (TIGR03086 family)